MNNEIIGLRIKEERESKGLTLQDIADEIGVAKSTVQRYETGAIGNIKLPVLAAIANVLKVAPEYLIGKSDNKTPDKQSLSSIKNIFPIETRRIPLLGEIACGEPTYAVEQFEHYVECGADIQADFALQCKGDSMINARIMDGDIVFVRSQPMVENREIAAVLIDDEATLKRVYVGNNGITLVAENPVYEPIYVSAKDHKNVRILGKAVAFQSDIK